MNNITAVYVDGLWETRDDVGSGESIIHESLNTAILLHYQEIKDRLKVKVKGKIKADILRGFAFVVIVPR